MKKIVLSIMISVVITILLVSCRGGVVYIMTSIPHNTSNPPTTEAPITNEIIPTPAPTEMLVTPAPTGNRVSPSFVKWAEYPTLTNTSLHSGGLCAYPLVSKGRFKDICPFAKWSLQIESADAEIIDDIKKEGGSEYQWNIYIGYKTVGYLSTHWSQPYECSAELIDGSGSHVVVALSPEDENEFMKMIETYGSCTVVIEVNDGDKKIGYDSFGINYNVKSRANYDLYKYFWSTRDKSLGISSELWNVTMDDVEYGRAHGFSWSGVDSEPVYVGYNTRPRIIYFMPEDYSGPNYPHMGAEYLFSTASMFRDGFYVTDKSTSGEALPGPEWCFALVMSTYDMPDDFAFNHLDNGEFTFGLWIKDIDSEYVDESWCGFWMDLVSVSKFDDLYNIFYLTVNGDNQYQPWQYLKVGNYYEMVINIERHGEEPYGFAYVTIEWTQELADEYNDYISLLAASE